MRPVVRNKCIDLCDLLTSVDQCGSSRHDRLISSSFVAVIWASRNRKYQNAEEWFTSHVSSPLRTDASWSVAGRNKCMADYDSVSMSGKGNAACLFMDIMQVDLTNETVALVHYLYQSGSGWPWPYFL